MAFRPLEPPRARRRGPAFWGASAPSGDEREWLIVVSPTSWTADEDFDLLLDAAGHWTTRAATRPGGIATSNAFSSSPAAVARCASGSSINSTPCGSDALTISTVWMEPDEYPALVAAADVGLCLHRSASGLDLPMKVMDFFGAGVPVCALDYGPCLAEAVRDGDNGLTFTDAPQLARLLVGLAGLESAPSSNCAPAPPPPEPYRGTPPGSRTSCPF